MSSVFGPYVFERKHSIIRVPSTTQDVITGLQLGADDYVTKPFRINELNARIEAVLRRAQPETTHDGPSLIQIGKLVIDLAQRRTLGFLADRRVFVAERVGQVIGFLMASPVPQRNGWLVEQMIRSPTAPNGTSELLLDAAMRTFAAEGAVYATLGLSPLSQKARIEPPPQPLLVRTLLFWVRLHGQRFYNFDGLDRFKAKFQPASWEPVYAVATGRHIPLHMLYAIAGVFGGTSPIWFVSQALGRAVRQEGRWLQKRVQQ